MKYDYLVVGAGLYGAVFAQKAKEAGKNVLVIDKRPNIAGNVYTEEMEGINVHIYGAHIFHTNNKDVWDFVNSLVPFNNFILNIKWFLFFTNTNISPTRNHTKQFNHKVIKQLSPQSSLILKKTRKSYVI